MATDSKSPYAEILARARSELTKDEQSRLANELSNLAAQNEGKPRRITDLRGLGAEIWKGVDVDQYISEERDSWDG